MDYKEAIERKADQIEKLIQGCSMHAGVTNRYWIALIVVSITVFTVYGNAGQAESVTLPFELGTVNAMSFYMICTVILSGITIAYVTTHLQVTMLKDRMREMRRQLAELEHELEKEREKEQAKKPKSLPKEPESLHVREMIASCITPNTNKVSTIPEYLFPEHNRHGHFREPTTRAILYTLLKLVSALFSYGVPLFALTLCVMGLSPSFEHHPVWIALLWFVALVAGFVMGVQIRSDCVWTYRTIARWYREYQRR